MNTYVKKYLLLLVGILAVVGAETVFVSVAKRFNGDTEAEMQALLDAPYVFERGEFYNSPGQRLNRAVRKDLDEEVKALWQEECYLDLDITLLEGIEVPEEPVLSDFNSLVDLEKPTVLAVNFSTKIQDESDEALIAEFLERMEGKECDFEMVIFFFCYDEDYRSMEAEAAYDAYRRPGQREALLHELYDEYPSSFFSPYFVYGRMDYRIFKREGGDGFQEVILE